jgi:hypothetical protein
MIAAQAVAMHLGVMECFRRSMMPELPGDVVARFRKDGASLARGVVEMLAALSRHDAGRRINLRGLISSARRVETMSGDGTLPRYVVVDCPALMIRLRRESMSTSEAK